MLKRFRSEDLVYVMPTSVTEIIRCIPVPIFGYLTLSKRSFASETVESFHNILSGGETVLAAQSTVKVSFALYLYSPFAWVSRAVPRLFEKSSSSFQAGNGKASPQFYFRTSPAISLASNWFAS